MRVHVARRYAAQFAIDSVNVGEHHQPHTERGDGQSIEERHHRLTKTARRNARRFSRTLQRKMRIRSCTHASSGPVSIMKLMTVKWNVWSGDCAGG